MTTTKKHQPSVRETDKNVLVLRLELNQKDVKRLRSQLSSYRCEPTTYSLFERIESLRNGLDNLSKTNSEIIRSLKEKKKKVDYYVERAKYQFSEFNNLHSSIEDYIQRAIEGERYQDHIPT